MAKIATALRTSQRMMRVSRASLMAEVFDHGSMMAKG
jgi:hypothetical protein